MTLHPIQSEFPYVWEKFCFLFYQWTRCSAPIYLVKSPPPPPNVYNLRPIHNPLLKISHTMNTICPSEFPYIWGKFYFLNENCEENLFPTVWIPAWYRQVLGSRCAGVLSPPASTPAWRAGTPRPPSSCPYPSYTCGPGNLLNCNILIWGHWWVSALQRQNTKIPKQIFPEKEYRDLSPNFHIHASGRVCENCKTFMRLWVIYIFPRSVCLFCWRKYVDRSWDYINRSQTHECGNWGWGCAIPRKGIHK